VKQQEGVLIPAPADKVSAPGKAAKP
jgi:hypothetical protein